MTKTIEQILGFRSSAKRIIPGVQAPDGREVWYVEYNGNDFDSEFLRLMDANQPPSAGHGGAITGGCELTLPDGRRFHAISFKGDLDGWRTQLTQGAQMLNRQTARILGNDLFLDGSAGVPLSSCGVRFY